MAKAKRTWYVAECFWAGVREQDLIELDRRVKAAVAEAAAEAGTAVRCLGRLLVLDDEVVLVLFEGPMDVVRRVAEKACHPYERLLRVSPAPWPNQIAEEEAPG